MRDRSLRLTKLNSKSKIEIVKRKGVIYIVNKDNKYIK